MRIRSLPPPYPPPPLVLRWPTPPILVRGRSAVHFSQFVVTSCACTLGHNWYRFWAILGCSVKPRVCILSRPVGPPLVLPWPTPGRCQVVVTSFRAGFCEASSSRRDELHSISILWNLSSRRDVHALHNWGPWKLSSRRDARLWTRVYNCSTLLTNLYHSAYKPVSLCLQTGQASRGPWIARTPNESPVKRSSYHAKRPIADIIDDI